MAIPQNKQELLADIETTYLKLKNELNNIPTKLTSEKTLEGHAKGTTMSVCNLVSYLTGWGELVIKWHKKKMNNDPVDFPETGYKWNELGLLAQKFYKDYDALDYPSLLKKLDTTVKEIQALVSNSTNETLYKKPWYEAWTMGRLIQLNTSSPYKNAHARLRKWKKE